MKFIKKVLRALLKALTAIILVAFMAVTVTSVSPIYDFEEPEPFSGPDIFNPYRNLDTAHCWKKANFHVHTRVKGIFNECEYWPAEVYEFLDKLGYDIVTFSNHNELTTHPFDSTLQVNVYEHGYNLFKYHKLVFGSKDVNRFDNLLPLLNIYYLQVWDRKQLITLTQHPKRLISHYTKPSRLYVQIF